MLQPVEHFLQQHVYIIEYPIIPYRTFFQKKNIGKARMSPRSESSPVEFGFAGGGVIVDREYQAILCMIVFV